VYTPKNVRVESPSTSCVQDKLRCRMRNGSRCQPLDEQRQVSGVSRGLRSSPPPTLLACAGKTFQPLLHVHAVHLEIVVIPARRVPPNLLDVEPV